MSTEKTNFKNLNQVLDFYIEANTNSVAGIEEISSDLIEKKLKLIKRLNTQAKASVTEQKKSSFDLNLHSKATELAAEYMTKPIIKLMELFGKGEFPSFQFNKLETLTKDELNEVLVEYFSMKLAKENQRVD